MSLGDRIRAAVAPAARALVGDLGSTIQIRRAVITRASDNAEIRNWSVIAEGTGVGCIIKDDVNEYTQKEWGLEESITAIGIMTDALGILAKDGVIVTDGHRKGTHFRVLEVRPNPMGGLVRLALQTTQERFA